MNYISIRNLDTFNHYSDRKPIWIKLYCSLISDPSFVSLSDSGKLSYCLLILLASQNNNKLPDSKLQLKKILHLDRAVPIEELKEQGFIEDWIDVKKRQPDSVDLPHSTYISISLSNRVIGLLNNITNKKFHETDGNRKDILARIKDGYVEDDFKKVIENRWAHWQGTEMEQYLRPSTLFRRSKFDGYLNSPFPSDINGRTVDKFGPQKLSGAKSALKRFVEGQSKHTALKTK